MVRVFLFVWLVGFFWTETSPLILIPPTLKIKIDWSPRCGNGGASLEHWDAGLFLGLLQQVKDLVLLQLQTKHPYQRTQKRCRKEGPFPLMFFPRIYNSQRFTAWSHTTIGSASIPRYQLPLLFFLGPHPQHMEVPRRGVKLELQLLACTTATATQDPSLIFNLHHSSQQH